MSKGLVMVDFWAPWCGPCRIIAPTIEELAKEYDGKIDVYKVDTEAEQELASVLAFAVFLRYFSSP